MPGWVRNGVLTPFVEPAEVIIEGRIVVADGEVDTRPMVWTQAYAFAHIPLQSLSIPGRADCMHS